MEQVNINRATIDELQRITGIGPVRAAKIIARRPYRDIHELSNVKGLGAIRMARIIEQNLVTV